LNNYQDRPFVPMIQKTSTLIGLATLSLLCFLVSVNMRTKNDSPSYEKKVIAAELMQDAMSTLKSARMEAGVFMDIENDPNETGLVGSSFSLITTDEGDLDAKLTTLDPNFSAAMVDLMNQVGLGEGDTVALLLTGSMPGANIAALTACSALGLVPVTITSVGASQWGANHEDFTWLDMEAILFEHGLIPERSVAASIGGRNDMGRLLSPAGRRIIEENIEAHGLPLIRTSRLADNIQARMDILGSYRKIGSFDAMINVGGGVASLGTSFNLKLLPPGVVRRTDVVNVSRPGGIEGILSKFAKFNVPVLHILNIRSLTEQLGIPFAPIPHPEIGAGRLYAEVRYDLSVATICLIIIGSSVFAVGYQSKKRIKEHLTKHEPDSLL